MLDRQWSGDGLAGCQSCLFAELQGFAIKSGSRAGSGLTSRTRRSPVRPTSPSDGGSQGDWAGPLQDLRDDTVSMLQNCLSLCT